MPCGIQSSIDGGQILGGKIQRLDDLTSRKIVASQVITSVACAVKELTENSIDAGASIITVSFTRNGLGDLCVSDDGIGIDSQSHDKLCKWHSTSKQTNSGIYQYLGFRGDALASLCALSDKVCIHTQTKYIKSSVPVLNSGTGEMLSPHSNSYVLTFDKSGSISNIRPSLDSHFHSGSGTIVYIFGLFSSLPVRRNEQEKTTKIEDIVRVMKIYSITNPRIQFKLIGDNGKVYFVTKGCLLPKEVSSMDKLILGGTLEPIDKDLFYQNLVRVLSVNPISLDKVEFGGKLPGMCEWLLWGFISSPFREKIVKSLCCQFFYWNNRPLNPPIKLVKCINEKFKRSSSAFPSASKQKGPIIGGRNILFVLSLYTRNYTNDDTQETSQLTIPNDETSTHESCIGIHEGNGSTFSILNTKNAHTIAEECTLKKIKDVICDINVSKDKRTVYFDPILERDIIERCSMHLENVWSIMSSAFPSNTEKIRDRTRINCLSQDYQKLGFDHNIVSNSLNSNTHKSKEINSIEKQVCCLHSGIEMGNLVVKADEENIMGSYDDKVSANISTGYRRLKSLSIDCNQLEQNNEKFYSETNKVYPSFLDTYGISNNMESNYEQPSELLIPLSKEDLMEMIPIGQFNRGFIIAVSQKGHLYIFDQHACDEKYLFEKYRDSLQIIPQPLLKPMNVHLPPDIIVSMDTPGCMNFLRRFGFEYSIFENNELRITSVGSVKGLGLSRSRPLNTSDMLELVSNMNESESREIDGNLGILNDPDFRDIEIGNTGFLREPYTLGSSILPPRIWDSLASVSCRNAVMIGEVLPERRMKEIVKRMGGMKEPWNCPHGRPTTRLLRSDASLFPQYSKDVENKLCTSSLLRKRKVNRSDLIYMFMHDRNVIPHAVQLYFGLF